MQQHHWKPPRALDGRTPVVVKRVFLDEELVDETAQAVHIDLFVQAVDPVHSSGDR